MGNSTVLGAPRPANFPSPSTTSNGRSFNYYLKCIEIYGVLEEKRKIYEYYSGYGNFQLPLYTAYKL